MMAISYGAETAAGQKVFFKQYKSPAPTVVWYSAFVAYQKELQSRVAAGKATNFAVRQLDAFEEIWGGRCYFSVYELVENGGDLQAILDEERELHRRTGKAPTADPTIWSRHVTWCRVFMAGMAALHEAKIVHADLKPANVYLIQDATIAAGYQLKLIDMDFSLLGRPPGALARSPGLCRHGQLPLARASAARRCAGLGLRHLHVRLDPLRAVERAASLFVRRIKPNTRSWSRLYAAKPPALLGTLPAPASNADVSAALHRCFLPTPANARPQRSCAPC
jgi:serine/threonine protein kinase